MLPMLPSGDQFWISASTASLAPEGLSTLKGFSSPGRFVDISWGALISEQDQKILEIERMSIARFLGYLKAVPGRIMSAMPGFEHDH